MKTNAEKLEALEHMAYELTKCGESAGHAVGDDLQSVIDSEGIPEEPSDEELEQLFGILEGELDNLKDYAVSTLKEVNKLHGEKKA